MSLPWSRLGAAGLAVACAVAVAELTARVDDWVRYETPLLSTPEQSYDLTMQDSLTVRGRPNGRFRHYELNEFGFRGPAITRTPRPGCVRVVVLGASETFGLTESPEHDFPTQTGELLAAAPGCHEVVNAGIAGMRLPAMRRFWRDHASTFGARLVAVYPTPAFYLADTLEEERMRSGRPPRPRSRLVQRIKDAVVLPAPVRAARARDAIAAATAGKPAGWVFTDVPPARLAAFTQDLEGLVADIRAAGAQPILLTHANRFTHPIEGTEMDRLVGWRFLAPRAEPEVIVAFDSAAAEATREIGRRLDVPVVDVARALGGRRELFADHQHFTDDGSREVARILSEAVVTLSAEGTPATAPIPAPAPHAAAAPAPAPAGAEYPPQE